MTLSSDASKLVERLMKLVIAYSDWRIALIDLSDYLLILLITLSYYLLIVLIELTSY